MNKGRVGFVCVGVSVHVHLETEHVDIEKDSLFCVCVRKAAGEKG